MVLSQKGVEWNNWSTENATSVWEHTVISVWETDLTRIALCENMIEMACDKTFKIMNKMTEEYSFTYDLIIYWAVYYKREWEIMRGWCNKGCKNLFVSFFLLLSSLFPLSPLSASPSLSNWLWKMCVGMYPSLDLLITGKITLHLCWNLSHKILKAAVD